MKILALDTTASACSVAICEAAEDNFSILGQFTISTKRTHSETLLPNIESLLSSVKICIDDIDMFALSAGPGSFTGVRIGASTVKGLAFGKNKICIGVSSLCSLAYNVRQITDGYICPLIDARGGRFFTALFSSDKNGITRITEDGLLTLDEIKDMLSKLDKNIVLNGDGAISAYENLNFDNVSIAPKTLLYQNAVSVAEYSNNVFVHAENKDVFTDINLSCVYILPSQAEREKIKRKEEK